MQAWTVETKGKLKPLNVRLVYKFVSLKICNRNTRTHFKLSDFHTNFGKLSRCQTLILSNFEPLTLCDSASLLSPHTSAHSGFGQVQPMHNQCIALNARSCFSVLQAFSKTKMTGRPPHFIRNSSELAWIPMNQQEFRGIQRFNSQTLLLGTFQLACWPAASWEFTQYSNQAGSHWIAV